MSEDILKKIHGAIPKSTKNSTKWAVNVWNDWVANRKSQVALPCDIPPSLVNITNVQLSHWMCRMVMEVRNQKVVVCHCMACVQVFRGLFRKIE